MTIWLFWRRIPPEIIILFLIDGLILLTSMYYGIALRYVIGDPYEYGEILPVYPRAITYTVLMLAALSVMGLYDRSVLHERQGHLIRTLASFLIGAVLMLLTGYVVPGLFLGRGSIALTTVLAFTAIAMARYILFRYFDRSTSK
jgi:FlaA1/EpsC-like NDP-sugar epimerase